MTRAPGPISVWSMTIDPATIAPGAMRTPRPRIERTTRASSTVVPSPNMLSSISPERMRAGGPSAERAKIGQRVGVPQVAAILAHGVLGDEACRGGRLRERRGDRRNGDDVRERPRE